MWSRNFIPDYGIKLLSFGLLLTTLSAEIHSVEGFVSCSPSPCKNGGTCLSTSRGEYFCNPLNPRVSLQYHQTKLFKTGISLKSGGLASFWCHYLGTGSFR
ncbi:Notch protein [Danaus plexippus plexippus]|uniref:Notch protein n=1 Tax=Danaus plexippus plexippus TaxID=278856 RepID=A0A212FGZ5_DANPL|nr:Notch protein [Danaus plexippus plexippus]